MNLQAVIERLSQDQLQAVILALIAGVVAIVAIVAFTKYGLHMLTVTSELDREKLKHEMEIKNKIIDQGIATGANLDALLAAEKNLPKLVAGNEHLDGELASAFGRLEIPPEEIEDALSRALLLEPSRKKAAIDAAKRLTDEGADHQCIMAAIRGLCSSAKPIVKETGITSTV